MLDSINTSQGFARQEQAFYTLFEMSQEPLLLVRPDRPSLPIEDCNPAMGALLGYNRDELVGKPLAIIREGPTVDVSLRLDEMRNLGYFKVENVYIHKDGSPLYLDITSRLVRLNDHEIVLSACHNFTTAEAAPPPAFASDQFEFEVNERTTMLSKINQLFRRYIVQFREVQEALRQSEERYRLLVSNVTDYAIVLIETQGHISSWNIGAENIIGFRADEVMGKMLREVLDITTPPGSFERAIAFLETNRSTYEIEMEIRRRDESRYWANVTITPLYDVEDQPLGYSLIMHDITERKRREESLRDALEKEREANTLKSHFVSTASHGFRTPLTAILSASGLMRRYGHRMTEQEKTDRLTRIETEVKGLIYMLNNALTLDRVDALLADFNPEPLDLTTVLPSMIAEAQVDAQTTHEINLVCVGNCGQVRVDKKLLSQIVTNLLSNAIKFTPVDRNVYFDAACEENQVILIVRDEGIGIDQGDLPSIIQPFYRGRNAGNAPGAGLGLTVAEQAVRLHGGTLNFASTLAQGTTFTVTLPLLPAEVQG